MDAHTLNAWTRFALQKGGIGSCTALIDNPATDLEDLMFMTGEKITILRRLDEGGSDDAQKSAQSGSSATTRDADPWFLVSVSLHNTSLHVDGMLTLIICVYRAIAKELWADLEALMCRYMVN